MKKHLYFMFSSILIILLNIYAIVSHNEIVKDMIESAKSLPESIGQKALDIYTKNGDVYIIVMASISILLSLLMITSIIRKTVTKRKFVVISILSLLLSPIDLITLISILNLILCITIKDDIKIKVVIPEIEYKTNKRLIISSIILILVYISQYFIKYITFIDSFILSVIFEILLLILSIILFFNVFKEEFILFKNNFLSYVRYILPKLGVGYLIYILVGLISSTITNQTTSVNQQALEQLSYWYIIPAAIIWAPIVEETLFRRCLRSFIKNKVLFIIVSALIFGLLHTIHEESLLNIFVIGLPYMVLGGYLAYIYTKTNNMFSNMFSHMLINSFALIMMLIGL